MAFHKSKICKTVVVCYCHIVGVNTRPFFVRLQKDFFFQVENFEEIGDPGEAWFGEEAAARMVNWLAGSTFRNKVLRFQACRFFQALQQKLKENEF